MKEMKLFVIQAITPLHVGAGRGLGHIDNPIVREKITGYPYIPGSAIKGIIADHYGADRERRKTDSSLATAFGMTSDGEESHAQSGALIFTDARLLALPVRSFYGTFALVTCPLALNRFQRDLESIGMTKPFPHVKNPKTVLLAEDSVLIGPTGQDDEEVVFLEDLDFQKPERENILAETLSQILFERTEPEWMRRFAVVPDDVFAFLSETGTEVSAHVRIDDKKKTVAKGALWYEETLPTETILCGLVGCDRVGQAAGRERELLDRYCGDGDEKTFYLQFGGKSTTGNGRCECHFRRAANQKK